VARSAGGGQRESGSRDGSTAGPSPTTHLSAHTWPYGVMSANALVVVVSTNRDRHRRWWWEHHANRRGHRAQRRMSLLILYSSGVRQRLRIELLAEPLERPFAWDSAPARKAGGPGDPRNGVSELTTAARHLVKLLPRRPKTGTACHG
jgi:hypothetical protein